MKSYLAIFLVVIICVACNEPPAGYFPPLCEKDAKLCPSNKDVSFVNPSYILAVKDISPKEANHPYNPSLVSDGAGGFIASFRDDHFSLDMSPFKSRTGVVLLDSELNIVPESITMLDGSKSRQDARLIRGRDGVYMVYNDLPPFEHFRTLFLAKLSFKNGRAVLENDGPLESHPIRTEKNWSPFFYADEGNKEHLMFSYAASPHRVWQVYDSVRHHIGEASTCKKALPWKWGSVRGGTPAILVGDEYISFFHSMFYDKVYNTRWYIFGAYTFDAKAPFCMKRISAEPIYFKEMYSAKSEQPSSVPGFAVFPAGLEKGLYKGQDALFVSYGDSDSASKVLVLDQAQFLETLVAIQ